MGVTFLQRIIWKINGRNASSKNYGAKSWGIKFCCRINIFSGKLTKGYCSQKYKLCTNVVKLFINACK